MIDRFSKHRFDDADAISDGGGVGKKFADLCTGGAVSIKLKSTRGHRETSLPTSHRSETLSVDDRLGKIFVE